jgi:hypothetical protein
MTDYALVLSRLYPDAAWTLDGNDYEGLTWLEDGPAPSRSELDAAWPSVAHEIAVRNVQSARRVRYQTETDGLFFAAQRDEGDLTEWKAAVDQIKADLPYPAAP